MRSLQNEALIVCRKKLPVAQEWKFGRLSAGSFLHAGEYCENVTPTISVRLIHAHKNYIVK